MMMLKSTNNLQIIVKELSFAARQRSINDTQWAARAGSPKETLSRLRRRDSCDFSTLASLASAVNMRLDTVDTALPLLTRDGHFPVEIGRDYEDSLLRLCASGSLNLAQWIAIGPHFFMAGLAVMLASVDKYDRCGLLMLAENISPGASKPDIFDRWLKRSPLRPSRFLPMLETTTHHAT